MLHWIIRTISICSEPQSEIAEKPNLTWLDAAQVPAICSSYSGVINNILS